MLNDICFVTDISLDVAQELDITCLRGTGLQPGEEELPEQNSQSQPGTHNTASSCFLDAYLFSTKDH